MAALTADERRALKAAIDDKQRRRLARAHARETDNARAARYADEAEHLPQAAEHVPPMTERELASLRSRRLH